MVLVNSTLGVYENLEEKATQRIHHLLLVVLSLGARPPLFAPGKTCRPVAVTSKSITAYATPSRYSEASQTQAGGISQKEYIFILFPVAFWWLEKVNILQNTFHK